jgi:hypothetical protein
MKLFLFSNLETFDVGRLLVQGVEDVDEDEEEGDEEGHPSGNDVRRNEKARLKSGVDVMITIFCDFWQFSAKYWHSSQKAMLRSNFCIIQLCFESKTPIFWRKYLKNHNIGPRSLVRVGFPRNASAKWTPETIKKCYKTKYFLLIFATA